MEEVYHIFNKTIAGFKAFGNDSDFCRMVETIRYYQRKPRVKFSLGELSRTGKGGEKLVEIFAYCVMPTHFHLLVKEVKDGTASAYINVVLNSYTKYFNTKYKRKGPLWEGRSKKVPVTTDEQLLHLTRYIHLNPVTAYLVERPEEWTASSYREYTSKFAVGEEAPEYRKIIDINPARYEKFVEEGIEYQRELKRMENSDR